jgi:hypothetical protein
LKQVNDKVFSILPITSWPILAALSFCRSFSENNLDKLFNAPSFQDQFSFYSDGMSIDEFIKLSHVVEIDSLKEVENIFEFSLAEDVRKAQGVVYTPDFIIDYILEQTIASNNIPTRQNPLLDPACGSGGFLIRASKFLSEKFGGSFTEWSEMLCGIDINPKAVNNARLLMDLACLENDGELGRSRFLAADSLMTDINVQMQLLEINGGVSALVTNPPYVKLQNLDEEYSSELIQRYPNVATGAFSLASLFLSIAPDYLAFNGHAGLITLNNIFTSLSGRNLRKLWGENRNIWKIIDFRHFAVFEASAYTCLIFLGKSTNDCIEYNAVGQMPDATNLKLLVPSSINYGDLNPEKWRLGDDASLKLISAMESRGIALKEVADIKVGFATLRDKAFIGKFVKGKPTFLGGDGVTRLIEDDSVHNFIKVSELNESSSLSDSIKPIIYPYDKTISSRPLIPISSFEARFPKTFEHLNSWKKILQSRGFTDEEEWHQWGRRQSLISNGPKLLTKTFDIRPNFRMDYSDSLFCNGYSVRPKEIFDGYSIDELQSFLQSRFVHAYCLVTSFEISGGYQCYQKNFIENICLPPPSWFREKISDNASIELSLCKFYGIEILELNAIISHYGAVDAKASS